MDVESKDTRAIVLKVSHKVGAKNIQRVIDYIKYLEATAGSKATQEDVDKLASQVNKSWWSANRGRLVN